MAPDVLPMAVGVALAVAALSLAGAIVGCVLVVGYATKTQQELQRQRREHGDRLEQLGAQLATAHANTVIIANCLNGATREPVVLAKAPERPQ